MTRRPDGIPFPHIPLDEVGHKLTADQLCTMLIDQWANRLSTELKVEMVLAGWRKFEHATYSPLRNLGMSERHVKRLWQALNDDIPQVAQINGGPVS